MIINKKMFEIIKAIHIIAIICWMAALFYLPRLFVYHADKKFDSDSYQTFLIMERRLIKIIMNPSMVISIISGVSLAVMAKWYMKDMWLHIKFLMVFGLIGMNFYFVKIHKFFVENRNNKSSKFFKIINEIPTILMIIIVALVVLKP